MSTLNGASNNTGKKKGMILPFQPLSMTFHNVNYFVDMPKVITTVLYTYIYMLGTEYLLLVEMYLL